MNTMTEMMSKSMKEMKDMPGAPAGMLDASMVDMATMQECIEACSACEQACTMCSDASMGMEMARCSSMSGSCADVCNTMMRMMMRPAGFDMATMMAMLEATVTSARACADECGKHADMHEHCKMCAQACMDCAAACEKMMTALSAKG